jgi:hypothetical protein
MPASYRPTPAALLLAALCLTASHAVSAATGLPFSSDFESGDYSDWSGGREPSMSVVTGGAYQGDRSSRSTMIVDTLTDNYMDYYFGDHVAVGGEPADGELWLALASKLDSDFDFGPTRFHKITIINFTDSNARRRYQMIVTAQRESREYFVELLKWNADRSFAYALPGLSQNRGSSLEIRFGQWDRLKVQMHPNTPGAADGVLRLWVNGELTMEYTDLYMREDSNFNPNVLIMSNYTEAGGTQWWDDFKLGETDPDLGVSDPAPGAPLLLPLPE